MMIDSLFLSIRETKQQVMVLILPPHLGGNVITTGFLQIQVFLLKIVSARVHDENF